jgi:hypothetical protein
MTFWAAPHRVALHGFICDPSPAHDSADDRDIRPTFRLPRFCPREVPCRFATDLIEVTRFPFRIKLDVFGCPERAVAPHVEPPSNARRLDPSDFHPRRKAAWQSVHFEVIG